MEELNKAIEQIANLGPDKLWELASWAKETDNLQPWQRGIAGSVAKLLQRGSEPSEKQAKQLIKLLRSQKILDSN